MANAIFYHKPDSQYDDKIEERYHFPKSYLSRVQQSLNDNIVYYGPNGKVGPSYFAIAKVVRVEKDNEKEGLFYAYVEDFINFDRPLPFKENGGYEEKLILEDGRTSGFAANAVRIITAQEFKRIIEAGLSADDDWPDRYDDFADQDHSEVMGFGESPRVDFERPIHQQLVSRKFRDRKFAQHIRKIYDRTCAFTGMRLINGNGRPEIEAAHIKPVSENGDDSVRNGLALSGTVHWMFDRGLLTLTDEFKILKSRHLNHDVSGLLVKDMVALVPQDKNVQPHSDNLRWHRENRFKN